MTTPTPNRSTSEMRYPEIPRTEAFNAWDPFVTKRIDELISLADGRADAEDTRDLVREIIVTALKTHHSRLDRGDVKILSRALRELRYGFRVFRPYREKRKVTIFGSARSRPGDADFRMARQFAAQMVRKGFMIITGAGPGIMAAGNKGAGKDHSFGVNIRLPFEQHANAFVAKDDRFIDCRFFFTRKLMFLKETSAVALFPGGFGTHDEGMEVLTLVQTGKADPMPLVFLEPPGNRYWSDWKKYIQKHLLRAGKISPEDMNLFLITDSVKTAVAEIVGFYRNYHSLRYVKDRMVIRLKRRLPPKGLDRINAEFKDIGLAGTPFTLSAALPEEKEYPALPRLVFSFNRFNFGRLRQLINALNEY
jgi:uncharacterized protein (TIGR00730 family)